MESTNPQLLPLRQLDDEQIDLLPHLRKLGEHWRLIALSVALTVIATALVDSFAMTRLFRAEALIRPIAAGAVEGRIEGFQGGIGGAAGGLGGLAAALGGGGGDADEYIAIMKGFWFNMALSERHRLPPEFLKTSTLDDILNYLSPTDPKWRLYRTLQDHFDCTYEHDTGNMTVSFTAESQRVAETVLLYYIDDLRDLLRARELSGASAAIDSLRAEALASADPVLRSQLYTIEAKQVERKKMAQVEADFAFRVLNAPAAPDRKYRPLTLLDCLVTGLLAAAASGLFVLLRYSNTRGETRSNVFQEPVTINPRKIGAI